MTEIVKVCKIHGNLTIDQTRKDGVKLRCTQCRVESNKKSYDINREKRIENATKWKQSNREHVNAWERADRAKDPEKYRKRERFYKKQNWRKLSVHESLRKLGLTNAQFKEMNLAQNNKCAICHKEETRIGRGGEICRLCIDHDHETGKIRALLCHDCNTGIGKFQDDIILMKKAITYLESHAHAT